MIEHIQENESEYIGNLFDPKDISFCRVRTYAWESMIQHITIVLKNRTEFDIAGTKEEVMAIYKKIKDELKDG